jgi:hypothetical protein
MVSMIFQLLNIHTSLIYYSSTQLPIWISQEQISLQIEKSQKGNKGNKAQYPYPT